MSLSMSHADHEALSWPGHTSGCLAWPWMTAAAR